MIPPRLDHIVYATPDVEQTVEAIERRAGIRASPGGQHAGRGTRNALLSLGPHAYLEIVGPDASQTAWQSPRWFGVDGLREPAVVTWAAVTASIDDEVAKAAADGTRLGPILSGRRVRADGVELTWRYTDPRATPGEGLVPFLIDWGAAPHPAASAAQGLRLQSMQGEHPDPDRIRRHLKACDLSLEVAAGPKPQLIVVLDSPRGVLVLS